MTIRMDSFRMDTPPDSGPDHALPDAHDRGSFPVSDR